MADKSVGLPNRRLDSWKEIAEYLSRDVRTVIRWEKDRALPVRRVPGGKKQAVFAFVNDLDSWLLGDAAESSTARTLAVLPFVNESGDSTMEYLADGITENLISRLSQLPSLRVLARSTVFRYKGPDVDAVAAARALKVPMAIAGSVRVRGDRLHVGVELVNSRDGAQAWGWQHAQPTAEAWMVEQRIAQEIAEGLHLHLTGEQKNRLIKPHTGNAEAALLFLKSRYEWFKFSEDGMNAAIKYLEEAIACDPHYGKAHAALADCYWVLAIGMASDRPPKELMAKAYEAATTALACDDTLAEAHTSLAMCMTHYAFELESAERELQRALQLNPSLPLAHLFSAYALLARRRLDEAAAEAFAAVALDPLSPFYLVDGAAIMAYAGRIEDGMQLATKALSLGAFESGALFVMGFLHARKGDYPKAIELLERSVAETIINTVPLGVLGYVYAISGDTAGAEGVLRRLDELSKHRHTSHYSRAAVYCGLGDKDNALRSLELVYEERNPWVFFINVAPWCDCLRDDSRFTDLVHRLKLD